MEEYEKDGFLALYLCIQLDHMSVNKALSIIKNSGTKPRRGLATRHTWTTNQVLFIKNNYKTMDIGDIARKLHLKRSQVKNKIKRLKRYNEIDI